MFARALIHFIVFSLKDCSKWPKIGSAKVQRWRTIRYAGNGGPFSIEWKDWSLWEQERGSWFLYEGPWLSPNWLYLYVTFVLKGPMQEWAWLVEETKQGNAQENQGYTMGAKVLCVSLLNSTSLFLLYAGCSLSCLLPVFWLADDSHEQRCCSCIPRETGGVRSDDYWYSAMSEVRIRYRRSEFSPNGTEKRFNCSPKHSWIRTSAFQFR